LKRLLKRLLLASSGAAAVIPDLSLPTTNRLYYFYGGNGSNKPSGITGTDGAGISSWLDKDSLVTAVQATGSAQPTYRQAAEVSTGIFRGCAEFGGDDFLQASVGILSLQTDYTWTIVVKTSHASGGTITAEGSTGSNTPFMRFDTNANKVVAALRDNASTTVNSTSTSDINNNAAHVITAQRIGTTQTIYVDGFAVAQDTDSTAALGALTTNRFIMGALYRATPVEYWDGQIYLNAAWGADVLADLASSGIKAHYGIA
jgi:hypothetical protein